MPTIGQLIAARAKRDPVFKRQVLAALRRKLTEVENGTKCHAKLKKAISAIDDMK